MPAISMKTLLKQMRADDRITLMPPASVHDIVGVERELSVCLPADFKEFLLLSDGARIGENVIPGAITRSAEDIVRETEVLRKWPKWARLRHGDVAVMDVGNGDSYCLATESMKDNRCPVILWHHELNERERKASSFAAWLRTMIKDPHLAPP